MKDRPHLWDFLDCFGLDCHAFGMGLVIRSRLGAMLRASYHFTPPSRASSSAGRWTDAIGTYPMIVHVEGSTYGVKRELVIDFRYGSRILRKYAIDVTCSDGFHVASELGSFGCSKPELPQHLIRQS